MIKNSLRQLLKPRWFFLLLLAILMLASAYLFQRINVLGLVINYFNADDDFHPHIYFIVNKTTRLILNDIACCILIYVFFKKRQYLKAGMLVFAFEALILLPLYFYLKLSLEGDSEISSPFLSQIHRLIINPMLMILLIMGFVYQKGSSKPSEKNY